jgi:hypothetical protein
VPIWMYEVGPLSAAVVLLVAIETLAMLGLFVVRRLVIPRLHYQEGTNEAVSGTVQAIGVFYGITVGLIAVGVWNTHSAASDLVSKEAMAIGALYRDVSGYPEPLNGQLRSTIREYTLFVIEKAWPAQKQGQGQKLDGGKKIMDQFQSRLYTFEPGTPSQVALHNETLKAYNSLIEQRNLRIDAVDSGLSGAMWAVIWVGASISIGIAYFYKIADPKLHAILVMLMGGFLSMVLFMIVMNDHPFFGHESISSEPYKLILDRVIDESL